MEPLEENFSNLTYEQKNNFMSLHTKVVVGVKRKYCSKCDKFYINSDNNGKELICSICTEDICSKEKYYSCHRCKILTCGKCPLGYCNTCQQYLCKDHFSDGYCFKCKKACSCNYHNKAFDEYFIDGRYICKKCQ
jgi:hypothetical protein